MSTENTIIFTTFGIKSLWNWPLTDKYEVLTRDFSISSLKSCCCQYSFLCLCQCVCVCVCVCRCIFSHSDQTKDFQSSKLCKDNFVKAYMMFICDYSAAEICNWILLLNQAIIFQWLARRLAAEEVPGSYPGKGDNY